MSTSPDSRPQPDTAPDRPTINGKHAVLGGAGFAILMVLCCAVVPLLAAGGPLGVLGAIAGNPLIITAAVLIIGAALATVILRRRIRAGSTEDCCPPPHGQQPHTEPKDRKYWSSAACSFERSQRARR